ncbi:MAG: Vitamin transporter BtuB [Pseudomonadota bacterium]
MKKTQQTHQAAVQAAVPSVRMSAIASATLLALSAGAVQAQQAALETVTITGIRKGIEDAISVKKNANNIVEAISAEDIGKLPDASVAESISRLPGVTMQRSAVTGRAQSISVRGMAPEFNGGLLNGREQATTTPERGIDLDQYPSELIANIVVNKTSNASLMSQGLSSTIDLQTLRPLSFAKRNVAVNFRSEHNAKADEGSAFTEGDGGRLMLSYVDQFADRTVGVALGVTRSKSKGGARPNFQTWGGWVADVCSVDPNPDGSCPGATVKVPGGFTTDIETTDSERTGGMAVLQFKPNKNFESTLDVFYSKGDFSVKKRGLEGPVGGLSAGANDIGGPGNKGGVLTNATIVNGVATSGSFTNFKGVIRNHNEDYTDTLTSIGWGNTLKAGDWSFNGDLSISEAKKDSQRYETTAGIPGNTYNAADTINWTGFNGSNLTDVKYSTGLNYADPSLIKLTDVQGWAGGTGVQDGYYANPLTKDKIKALRLSGKRDINLGPIVGIDGGVNFNKRDKTRVTREGALVLNGGLNADGSVADRLISAPIPGATTGVGGMTGIPTLNWNPAGSLGSVYTLNPWTDHDIVGKSWAVQEKINTVFAKGDIDTLVGGLPLRGNVGVQLVSTKVNASGYKIDQSSCNTGTHTCSFTAVTANHSFTDTLPSLNLSAELGGDQVLRFGAGRVIARPNMDDMKPTIDFSNDSTLGTLKGSAGNPNLEPFRADAIDISYEKYFGNKGYVSVAGFQKSLKSYIIRQDIAGFDFSPYIGPGTSLPGNGSTVGTLTQTVNGTGGSISGVELAVNVPFSLIAKPLNGFGATLSYSNTNSSVDLPSSGLSLGTGLPAGTKIPLPGLSKNVTNLKFYYENGGFQVAVARRHRSDYLGKISDFQDRTQLVFVKAEETIDVQVAYDISEGALKGLSLLAQANNVTNSEYANYDMITGNTTDKKKFGASYLFGLAYKF